MNNLLEYIFTHLFGTTIGNTLLGEVQPMVSSYLSSNPGTTLVGITAYANTQIASIVASVANKAHIPAWAEELAQTFIEQALDSTVASVYAKIAG